MDDTKATRQMLAAAQNQNSATQNQNQNDMGTIDFTAEREEAKEDEYDYFLDN